MRIAFDLDNTLLRFQYQFPLEKSKLDFFRKLLSIEPIRKGFIELFQTLKKHKHQIWIYTASNRPRSYIRSIFWMYGVHLDGVVNYDIHHRKMSRSPINAVKYPPAFGIDYLIDDSEGIKIEGEMFNYKVIVINPNDLDWTQKIKKIIIKAKL